MIKNCYFLWKILPGVFFKGHACNVNDVICAFSHLGVVMSYGWIALKS